LLGVGDLRAHVARQERSMPMSPTELARCTQTAARILEELGLAAYQFAVEPRDDEWDVLIECSAQDGWHTLSLPIDHDALAKALDDGEEHDRILADWGRELSFCRREGTETPSPQRRADEQPSA
jgi:hypothetical protein